MYTKVFDLFGLDFREKLLEWFRWSYFAAQVFRWSYLAGVVSLELSTSFAVLSLPRCEGISVDRQS